MLATLDPQNIKTILATSFDDFDKGPRIRAGFVPLIGNGVFAPDGKRWHEGRALLRPSFAKSEMNDTQLFERHFQCFLRLLPADGVAMDLQGLLNRLTMDMATDLLFGSSTGSLSVSENSEATRFSLAAETGLKAAFMDISLGRISKILNYQNAGRAREYGHKTVDRYVQETLERWPEGLAGVYPHETTNKGRRYLFLEHLVEKTKDTQTLRDQSLSALFGGRETTASLLSKLLYILARLPNTWGKLRTEALNLCDQPLNQETMKNAPYLSYCIHEGK